MTRTSVLHSIYRQQRAQILLTGTLVVALVVIFLGGAVTTRRSATQIACPTDQLCQEKAQLLIAGYLRLAPVIPFLLLIPVVIGIFWGAPVLAREYERGTTQLAWTQAVPRSRWLSARLGLLGTVVLVFGLMVGVSVTVWLNQFIGLDYPGVPPHTDQLLVRGFAPGISWLTAFLIGAMWGALLRHLIPAMAVTAATVLALVIGTNLLEDPVVRLFAPGNSALAALVLSAFVLLLGLCAGAITVWRTVVSPA